MAPSKSSDEVLRELREKARERRHKPRADKPKRPPSLRALTIKALRARAASDPQFAATLARAITAYQPMVEAWIAGTKRPSPVRRKQIRRFFATRTREREEATSDEHLL